MHIEERSLESIKPYENNPRNNDAAVAAVAESIRTFGIRQPLVVDEQGVIIVGHTRFKAAQKLGLKSVPVHVATGLSKSQVRAYRIADNKTASLSTWNDDLLTQELLALQKEDFDLDLTGFSADELLGYLQPDATPGLTDPDEIPALPDEAITQPGDLWILGNHRLLCGDSSKAEDVDRLLDGATIQLVNTDPPYGVAVEPRSRGAIAAGLNSFDDSSKQTRGKGKKLRARDRPIANDAIKGEDYQDMLLGWFQQIARVLEPGRAAYLWGGYANVGNYPEAMRASGLHFAQAVVWVKEHPVLNRKDFMSNHEVAYYGWREGAAHQFFGPNNVTDVWSVKKVAPQSMIHLTEKPVELAARALQYSSRPGENVLDLFGGSGSTLIAAEQTGRKAFVMELDPLYVDVIVQRYETFAGKKARRG